MLRLCHAATGIVVYLCCIGMGGAAPATGVASMGSHSWSELWDPWIEGQGSYL